jgi:RecA/RadA recombinase
MSLLDKLKKNTTIKDSAILAKSKFFDNKDMIKTSIPALNIALSGDIDGGFSPGLTLWAGPSKHFKTAFTLLMVKAYQDKYPDSVILFYDSEFFSPKNYFESFGIDTARIVHTPITDIEQLKFDVMNQLKEIQRGERVMIIVDSIGNLASKKEVDDAVDQKSVSDMTRAKQIKSLFRMITPHLTIKDIPMVAVAHIYMTQEMFSKPVVSGGTGPYYSADNIFIVGRQQEKDGTDLIGYSFIVNVEKSRYVREKAKIPVTVTYEGGVSKYSGLLEMALESGHVVKPNQGWYSKVNLDTGEVDAKKYRIKDTDTAEFWEPILADASFKKWVVDNYRFGNIMAGNLTEEFLDEEA